MSHQLVVNERCCSVTGDPVGNCGCGSHGRPTANLRPQEETATVKQRAKKHFDLGNDIVMTEDASGEIALLNKRSGPVNNCAPTGDDATFVSFFPHAIPHGRLEAAYIANQAAAFQGGPDSDNLLPIHEPAPSNVGDAELVANVVQGRRGNDDTDNVLPVYGRDGVIAGASPALLRQLGR